MGAMETRKTREPFSCFLEREQEPSSDSVRKALGKACPAWDELQGHLREAYGLTGTLHFMYGQRYGWALRFRRGEKLIVALYPNVGRLTVQIVLGRAQVARASAMHLEPNIAKVLRAAKDYPEGRWSFVPVKTRKSARELRDLIALKFSRKT